MLKVLLGVIKNWAANLFLTLSPTSPFHSASSTIIAMLLIFPLAILGRLTSSFAEKNKWEDTNKRKEISFYSRTL
jgi:hypothetical protein